MDKAMRTVILMTKWSHIFFLVLVAAVLSTSAAAASTDEPVETGAVFPQMAFETPQAPEDRNYLGLPDGKHFSIGEVKADLVVLEILNVYCISCQKQVPLYNKLYDFIEDNPDMRGKVKIMAVGAGNDAFEIKEFRESLNVKFPVIPDPDFETYELLNVGETPYSLFVHPDPFTGVGTIAGTHKGAVFGLKSFVINLKRMAEAEKGTAPPSPQTEKGPVLGYESVISQKSLEDKIRALFEQSGNVVTMGRYKQDAKFPVYSGEVRTGEDTKTLYAVVVSRPVPCDLCHDVHFIYVFDASGVILALEPLQLRKYGNDPFSDKDVAKLRSRVVGRSLEELKDFHPEVDAVSTATITSSVLFNSLAKGNLLFNRLRSADAF
jgi:hypothetical protein